MTGRGRVKARGSMMRLRTREVEQMSRERDDYRKLLLEIRHRTPRRLDSGLEITCIGNTGGSDNIVHGRPAGGLLLAHADRTIVIDPGDNSLAYLAGLGLNPYDITDVLASHAHNDHVGDLSAVISAAVNLALDPHSESNIVVCPSLVDYSDGSWTKFGFTLPAYAWNGNVKVLYWKDLEVTRFDGVRIRSQPSVRINESITVSAAESRHGYIRVTGFVIDTPMGRIAYTSDTEYFPELADYYAGVDVLWMNMNTLALDSFGDIGPVPRAATALVQKHLGYVGVCKLIEELRPRTAIVSHLGAQLLEQRGVIEDLLKERFHNQGIGIYCPCSGDSYLFEKALSVPPTVGRFRA